MKISELVEWLEDARKQEGDIEVKWLSLSHLFEVEPKVKDAQSGRVVVVNP